LVAYPSDVGVYRNCRYQRELSDGGHEARRL
jgi:hypothetical protein